MKSILITCLALCLVQVGYSQTPQEKYTLVITNVNVVDVRLGKIVPNRLLAISHDTIKAIDDAKKRSQYKAERYVNAEGKYVMPGLWDMHVHFRGGDTLINENKALLPLFLAYGVTTVRDAGGDITSAVMQWRKQIAAGMLAGPKIFTSGPKIDGSNAFWPGSLKVESSAQVTKALDSLQKLGVDYVKLYEGSRDIFLEVIREAEKRGLKTTGHLPVSVKVVEAAQAGLDAIEHMLFVYIPASAQEDSITHWAQQRFDSGKLLSIFTALPVAHQTYSAQRAGNLFKLLASTRTAVLPTLFVLKTAFAELKESDHSRDTLLTFIDPKIQATYQRRINDAKRQSEETTLFYKKLMQQFMTMVPQMQAAGVTLLAGSDCGPYNSFVYPGEALHEELKLLVSSGLTPVQALQAATINAAKFMGADKFYGDIQKGKSADLIVLDTNPLINIEAINGIHMVLSNGKIYSRSDLNNLLQAIKH